jgi:hypothetical protein
MIEREAKINMIIKSGGAARPGEERHHLHSTLLATERMDPESGAPSLRRRDRVRLRTAASAQGVLPSDAPSSAFSTHAAINNSGPARATNTKATKRKEKADTQLEVIAAFLIMAACIWGITQLFSKS